MESIANDNDCYIEDLWFLNSQVGAMETGLQENTLEQHNVTTIVEAHRFADKDGFRLPQGSSDAPSNHTGGPQCRCKRCLLP
eukprot:2159506-Rhodomonas_salina.1